MTPEQIEATTAAKEIVVEVYRIFDTADREWSHELDIAFGIDARDKRYQEAGRGRPGTPLRAAYARRQAAWLAWDRLRDADLTFIDI